MTTTAPDAPSETAPARESAAPSPERRRLLIDLAIMAVVVTIVASPLLFTGRTFGADWRPHLWMTWVQGQNIASGGPSYFFHTGFTGVWNPHYGFYGGTLYTIGGALSLLLGGSGVTAYIALWVAGFTAAYGGLLWIGRQAGLRAPLVHAAPILYVTSNYPLANAYARGVMPEFVATSMLPLVAASTLALLLEPRVRVRTVAAMLGSTIVMTGAHSITLLWGTATLIVLALVGAVGLIGSGRLPRPSRIALTAGVFALGGLTNAWYLLNTAVNGRKPYIGSQAGLQPEYFERHARPDLLFSVWPVQSSGSYIYGFSTALPVLALAWILGSAIWLIPRAAPGWRRVAVGVLALFAAFLWLVISPWPWENVIPSPFDVIQFSFRMETYVLLAAALLLVVLLRIAGSQRERRADTRLLWPMLLTGAVLSMGFIWTGTQAASFTRGGDGDIYRLAPLEDPPRSEIYEAGIHSTPWGYYFPRDYRDHSLWEFPVPDDRTAAIEPSWIHHDRWAGAWNVPAGPAPFSTNISGGSYVVKVTGDVQRVGRTDEDFAVFRRTPGTAMTGPVQVRIEPASTPVIVAGRWITFGAIAGGLALIGTLIVRRRRSRADD